MGENENTSTEEAAAEEHTASGEQQPETDQLGDGGKKALEAERSRAKELEKRAKAAERALEAEKAKGLTESERAIAEAKLAGRQEAAAEAGKRLASAELRAAAAAKGVDVTKQLGYLDLARFVAEDGEPDAAAIADWVKTLPEPSARPRGSADQGARVGGVPQTPGDVFAEVLQRQLNSTR